MIDEILFDHFLHVDLQFRQSHESTRVIGYHNCLQPYHYWVFMQIIINAFYSHFSSCLISTLEFLNLIIVGYN